MGYNTGCVFNTGSPPDDEVQKIFHAFHPSHSFAVPTGILPDDVINYASSMTFRNVSRQTFTDQVLIIIYYDVNEPTAPCSGTVPLRRCENAGGHFFSHANGEGGRGG
jgi:hypothetical protein